MKKPEESRYWIVIIVLTIFVGLTISMFFVENTQILEIIMSIIPWVFGILVAYFFGRIIPSIEMVIKKFTNNKDPN